MKRARIEGRDARLKRLGYRNYRHYLSSPGWAARRAAYRAESSLPQTCFCGEEDGLQLHHMTYERVGEEELADLTPLCSTCHKMLHALVDRGEIGLDFTGFVNERRAARHRAVVEAKLLAKTVDQAHELATYEDMRWMVRKIRRDAGKLKCGITGEMNRANAALKRAEQQVAVRLNFGLRI